MKRMNVWQVYLDGILIQTVGFDIEIPVDDIKEKLIKDYRYHKCIELRLLGYQVDSGEVILPYNTDGKIKRLTKQRNYWKRKFEEVDIVLTNYPKLIESYRYKIELFKREQEIREKDALIMLLDRNLIELGGSVG